MMVDPRNIIIKEGFNVRIDLGDIEELKNSIVENGLKNPLRGYKDRSTDEKFILIDGHRRLIAIQKAIEEGVEIARVPVMLAPKGYNEEQRTMDLILCNDGKKLTAYEEGLICQRLINFGFTQVEIPKKIGRSPSFVSNVLRLANSSKAVQNKIVEGKISDNTVLEIIKSTDDVDKQLSMIEKAIVNAETKGGSKRKATAKNLTELKKSSPMQTLIELKITLKDKGVENEKTKLLEKLVSRLKKKLQAEELIDLFE